MNHCYCCRYSLFVIVRTPFFFNNYPYFKIDDLIEAFRWIKICFLQKSSESIGDMKTNSVYIQKIITNFKLYQIINFTIKYNFKASELLPD